MTDTKQISETPQGHADPVNTGGSINFIRVVCAVCGAGFAYRQAPTGRLRRFCSAECKHEKTLVWKATWRSKRRAGWRGPGLFDDLEP